MHAWTKKWLALALALVMMLGLAQAEETLGVMKERGVVLPMTQADTDLGLQMLMDETATADGLKVPVFFLCYFAPGADEALAQAYAAFEQGDQQAQQTALNNYYQHTYITDVLYMIKGDYDYTRLTALVAATTLAGNNSGYVYLHEARTPAANLPEHQAGLDAALARSRELMAGLSFCEVELPPENTTQMPNGFPAFTTVDLAGNTVTNEIFLGKKLTVVNIWGTYCGPCINEMPELAAWAAEMPEGVQIIGLVSDLYSTDNAETLETAVAICEATNVTYPNLVAGSDFAQLLSGVIGVPTTIFVDGTGAIVGDPIVGANVPAYKAFVEEYLNAQ